MFLQWATGAWVSLIVTVNVQLLLMLPTASCAVYVTVVLPKLKKLPGTKFEVTYVDTGVSGVVQLSENVGGVQLTNLPQPPVLALRVIFAGQPLYVGGVKSWTFTENVQAPMLLDPSFTRSVTLLSPGLNTTDDRLTGCVMLVKTPPFTL